MNSEDSINRLAFFGGDSLFPKPIHVGQLYLPEWDEFVETFQDIFKRRYFTNHGPLVQQLDSKFAEYLGVKNAICVTNGTIALMVALKSLQLSGEVIVPSFTFPATVQAIEWAGLDVVFSDVELGTHNISVAQVENLINDRTCAILGVHLWGRACDPDGLQELCKKNGIKLIFDAAHAVGCTHNQRLIGGFGDVETFSFHATKVLNGSEGGCLTTNNDVLADRIRTIRNFHISESFCNVPLRINGKMSEAQAAMGLLGLKNIDANIEHNKAIYSVYAEHAKQWPGVNIINLGIEEISNYQYIVAHIEADKAGIDRDALYDILQKENVLARRYFYPGAHKIPPWCDSMVHSNSSLSNTDKLSKSLIQLPVGEAISIENSKKICVLISGILDNAKSIFQKYCDIKS